MLQVLAPWPHDDSKICNAMGKLDFLAENSAAKKFCSAKNRRQTDG